MYSIIYIKKIKAAVARWQAEIAEAPESGGRLVWYRQIKNDPSTEIYLTTMNSLGGRRAMRDSGQAAYHWRWRCVETLECPTDKGCAGCVIVGKWRSRLTF